MSTHKAVQSVKLFQAWQVGSIVLVTFKGLRMEENETKTCLQSAGMKGLCGLIGAVYPRNADLVHS